MTAPWRSRPPVPANEEAGRPDALPIHADATTAVFHLPQCAQYNCPECRLQFKNVRIAREAGFVPCEFCATLIGNEETPPQ